MTDGMITLKKNPRPESICFPGINHKKLGPEKARKKVNN